MDGYAAQAGIKRIGKEIEFPAELLWTMFLIQINRKSVRIKCSGAQITKCDAHCKHKVLPRNKMADILELFFTFKEGTYSYVPETNHVSNVCNVAAIL